MQDTLTPWPSEWINYIANNENTSDWWQLPYISTVSFDIWQATPPRSSARTTTKQPYALIEEAWGEFWAYSWVHKRSPWLVEDGCSVRHSAQVQQLQTHQRFCQVAFAHILRRQGDSEGVVQRWDGQWVHREGLSQGRGSSHLRWWHSSSNVLYGLRTWQSSTMTIYANGRAFQSVGEVQHSKSGFNFYLIFLRSWIHLPVAKTAPELTTDSILQCDVIWILNLLPGLERLASKGVGRSIDTVNCFMTILPQRPCSRQQKRDNWLLAA